MVEVAGRGVTVARCYRGARGRRVRGEAWTRGRRGVTARRARSSCRGRRRCVTGAARRWTIGCRPARPVRPRSTTLSRLTGRRGWRWTRGCGWWRAGVATRRAVRGIGTTRSSGWIASGWGRRRASGDASRDLVGAILLAAARRDPPPELFFIRNNSFASAGPEPDRRRGRGWSW